mmetsp:Transcript_1056/g.1458  ORF Transcript_1056/g.1458 Transcript_1056/m.1458 type:complete len:151 (+) Transcript_1056:121-573(+)
MKSFSSIPYVALLLQIFLSSTQGFSTSVRQSTLTTPSFGFGKQLTPKHNVRGLKMSGNDDGVVELADDDEDDSVKQEAKTSDPSTSVAAPFLSQGNELAEGVLNPDLNDPKQTRVIIYIILSLIPVLFLIPLMLGSRDLIPLDAIPPVEI